MFVAMQMAMQLCVLLFSGMPLMVFGTGAGCDCGGLKTVQRAIGGI